MNRHVHADKIIAKAENMDLVVFEKQNTATHDKELFKEISPDGNRAIWFHESYDYFLCLEKHKKAVLNALNGGDSQLSHDGLSWTLCNCNQPIEWSPTWWYMKGEVQSRIKPKKEKRVIGVNVKTGQTTSMYTLDEEGNYAEDEVRLTKGGLSTDWQIIEIEVEV